MEAVMQRGPLPGEITLSEVEALWGFGHTRTWQLVAQEGVIPFRRDRQRIYVRRADAEAYVHEIRKGRPPTHPDEGAAT